MYQNNPEILKNFEKWLIHKDSWDIYKIYISLKKISTILYHSRYLIYAEHVKDE